MWYRTGSETGAHDLQIRRMARRCACIRGIASQEREDFVAWCSEYLLVLHREETACHAQGEHAEGWLRTVIDHRAIEWLRHGRQQRLHEVSWPESSSEEGYRQVCEAADGHAVPERACLCASVSVLFAEIIGQMTPSQQELYRRRFQECETTEAIARSQGKTANAVRQQVYHLRQQIIARLQRRGETYESLRQALTPPLTVS